MKKMAAGFQHALEYREKQQKYYQDIRYELDSLNHCISHHQKSTLECVTRVFERLDNFEVVINHYFKRNCILREENILMY